jgi:lipopolysaccharide export LptBFGC system permease protein LptF
LVLGSAIATPLGLPMMALLAFPLVGYASSNPWTYYIGTLLGLSLYLLFIITLLLVKNRIKD